MKFTLNCSRGCLLYFKPSDGECVASVRWCNASILLLENAKFCVPNPDSNCVPRSIACSRGCRSIFNMGTLAKYSSSPPHCCTPRDSSSLLFRERMRGTYANVVKLICSATVVTAGDRNRVVCKSSAEEAHADGDDAELHGEGLCGKVEKLVWYCFEDGELLDDHSHQLQSSCAGPLK